MLKRFSRSRIVRLLSGRLSHSRIQISIMLAMTSFSVVIASAILIRFGMTTMAWRLLLAGFIGYVVFLCLLRIWIWLCRERHERSLGVDDPSFGDVYNVGDGILNIDIPSGSGGGAEGFSFGGGGDFAGAGAGGDFEAPNVPMPVAAFSSAGSPPSSGGLGLSDVAGGSGFDLGDVDLDDGLALLVVALVAILVLGALVYVIFIAPTLFAELLIDSAVVGGLYKHVDSAERSYWLKTALRKTAIPAVIVLILLTIAGAVMQAAVPEAITAGDFFRAVL